MPVEIGGVLEEKYFDFQIEPRRDTDGAILGVLIQVVVTEHAQARQAAERAAIAAEQRHGEARDVVVQLQDAMLSGDLPLVPGMDVSACYLLAMDDSWRVVVAAGRCLSRRH